MNSKFTLFQCQTFIKSAIALFSLIVYQPRIHSISFLSYFFNTSYPNSECTPRNAEIPNLKLTYSERTKKKNVYAVGWNYHTEVEPSPDLTPSVGGEVKIIRCLPPGKWFFLGKGHVETVNGVTVQASITGISEPDLANGILTKEHIEAGNNYWRPMAGDTVIPLQKTISKKVSINPVIELATQELFRKSDDGIGYTYELSEEGENLLEDKFFHFLEKRGRIQIQGFVLTAGDNKELRLESLMRAQAIAKFLSHKFKIDPEKIVTFGYGNDWHKAGMRPLSRWPAKNAVNGVIIKLLPEEF